MDVSPDTVERPGVFWDPLGIFRHKFQLERTDILFISVQEDAF